MAWFILLLAGLLEVVWAIGLKYTEGFTRFTPTLITVLAMIASVALLAHAIKTLPVGTAYAIWTGIGVVGASIMGIMLFKEPVNIARLASLGLVIIGIAGLKLSA